ncbi:MAG: ribose 5-phosphate isomerase B [Bacteroidales bacterium]|nr:ribose 5-phosphate isomerase B [Bacteroidales bacterium]
MLDKSKIFAIGSDHAGYKLKEYVKSKLAEAGYEISDYGTFSEDSMDYPDSVHPLAKDINDEKLTQGIVICGSGNGVSMTANKYPKVRAALSWIPEIAALGKRHNNANLIALPARFVDKETAWEIVQAYLNAEFEGGRHQKRVNKIAPKNL